MTALKPSLGGATATVVSLVLIATGSALLALQGWAGRLTGFDLVPHAKEAALFLKSGLIPSHGCLSSLGSYIPPGTSWLIVPGQWLFADPCLETVPGAVLLHLAAVAGVYALARWCWGRSAGIGAALLFAFSPIALKAAASLWPRFPMAAAIWFAFLIARWASDRKPACFAAGVLVLLLGLHVHMEGLLLAGVIPLIWILFRPPLFSRWLPAALALGLLVWLPYLSFEHGRNYVDLKSQVGLHSLLYTPQAVSRVNAMAAQYGFPPMDVPPFDVVERPLPWKAKVLDAANTLALRIARAFRNLEANFTLHGWGRVAAMAAGLTLLLCLLATALPVLRPLLVGRRRPRRAATGAPPPLPMRGRDGARPSILFPSRGRDGARPSTLFSLEGHALSWPFLTRVMQVAGLLALLGACCANEWVLTKITSSDGRMEDYTRNTIRLFQGVMACAGGMLLFWRPMLSALRRGAGRCPSRGTPVAVMLLVVWGAMAWMSGNDTPYRFWYLWPLQVVILVGLVTTAAQALFTPNCVRNPMEGGAPSPPSSPEAAPTERRPPFLSTVILAALVALTLCSLPVRDRLRSWRDGGWQGGSDEITALQSLAQAIGKEGRRSAFIGYQMPFSPFMAYFHVFDPGYKIGWDYDWYLQSACGIRNDNLSPAGLSERDQYRVVVSRPLFGNQIGPLPASTAGWHRLGAWGVYALLQKE